MLNMQCVILAGGLAKRMRPLTESIPKSMVPICGKPFIHHQLSLLSAKGINRITLLIGYKGDQIREYVLDGSEWGVQVDYVEEEIPLRGTGGALRNAFDQGALESRFILTYGDSYLPSESGEFFAEVEFSKASVTMMIFRNENQWDKSNVSYDSETKKVRYDKKASSPEFAFIDYGLLAVDRNWIEKSIPANEIVDLSTPLKIASDRGEVEGIVTKQRFYEIGSPSGYAEFERYLEGLRCP